ncbi:MAG: EAL domain-containing protein [Nitrosomonadales bacterium]|nr:EAL domain-containing protein [Nitrosomonadales bacterium]
MSLMRQLWLAVIVSTVMAFAGSLVLSIWSAQGYLTQQLERKNDDVANSLGLSMTQQEKDPVTIELQVTALFDTGYYQTISVTDPFGKVIAQRIQDKSEANVPSWFIKSFPIKSKPGLAQISDGWKQYGMVTVISHTQFAYQALWEQAGKLLFWFCAGGVGVGFLGTLVLRTIGRSLNDVVNQAGAIGERRFITIAEPRTPELRALARAMNGMVDRVRQMFNEVAARLDELLHRVNYDQLTGLPNRDYFMTHFKEQLTADEVAHSGVLAVMRLDDLNQINDAMGRAGTDNLLKEIGQIFTDFSRQQEGALAGRVKAGEIALVLPGEGDSRSVAQRMEQLLAEQLVMNRVELSDIYHLGVVHFEHGANVGDILSRVDHALALAQGQGANTSYAIESDVQVSIIPGEQWRALLTQAVTAGNVKLIFYPVIKQDGTLLHREGMVRLQPEPGKQLMMAGDFMPVAARLNLTAQIDLEVIRLALEHLSTIVDDVAVNLSAETISNWAFHADLSRLLRSHTGLCSRLWFEVSEYGAFKHFDAFMDICLILKNSGCHIGVEHFGQRLSESQKLTELGLDYVKIHPGLVRGIEENAGNQEFLQRFCGIAHAVGVIVIAVGVQSDAELLMLRSLGVDGATGSAITL